MILLKITIFREYIIQLIARRKIERLLQPE